MPGERTPAPTGSSKVGRLDRAQIEAILAPPTVVARAMPRRPGDEPNFFRRCDGYLIPPKKSEA
jgi:hypothetical protein